jgi:glutathione S-transferase
MQLFYAPNTISMSVAIALQEAGLGHELTCVDFTKAEQSSETYLAKNPKGRVPTLIVGDKALTETGALLEYIAALVPEKKLAPLIHRKPSKCAALCSTWPQQCT